MIIIMTRKVYLQENGVPILTKIYIGSSNQVINYLNIILPDVVLIYTIVDILDTAGIEIQLKAPSRSPLNNLT